MSQHKSDQLPHTSSVKVYTLGFCLALVFTIIAYVLVDRQLATGYTLIALLLGLAAAQTTAQLWFFLHVGREDKPRWNTIFLFNTISIILLIVICSIWIMNSLNYRMMTPELMEKYAIEEGKKGF